MCSLVQWGALCVLYVRCSRPCLSVLLSVLGVVTNHQCAVPLSAVPRTVPFTVPFVECWTVPPFKAYRSPTPWKKRQIEATNSNIEGSNKLFVHNALNQFKERNQPFTTTHWRIRSTNQCEIKPPFTACTEAIKKLAVRRHASINGMHIAWFKAHISSVRFVFPLGSIMNGVHISWSVGNLGGHLLLPSSFLSASDVCFPSHGYVETRGPSFSVEYMGRWLQYVETRGPFIWVRWLERVLTSFTSSGMSKWGPSPSSLSYGGSKRYFYSLWSGGNLDWWS